MKETCASCQYFLSQPPQPGMNLKAGRIGLCRRMPPQVTVFPTPQGMAVNPMRPPVQEEDWCGEYTVGFKMVGGAGQ
jgi:hypothetical protein